MYVDVKKIISGVVILLVGVVIGFGVFKINDNIKSPKQTVTIAGTGEVEAITDQVNITIEVKTISTTYEQAQTENKKSVDSLKSDLKKLGIPESRITTSSYSQPVYDVGLQPEFNTIEYPALKMIPRPSINANPSVITNFNLIIDPIKDVEKIYDLVSKSTSAQITSTYYSLKDQKTWETKAKEEAVKDARAQVETVAKINRLRVGKLVNLTDNNNPQPYMMELKATDSGSGDESVQSAPAEVAPPSTNNTFYSEQTVKISSSYTAVYELY